ncbi:hypothetical protein CHS0354_000831 [Potamilus streckersoni]|uniref:Alpha-glucosidase n=1 Tax=Potamilus streckersoni TaxID=2493646 RepID=A0AAE0W8A0_9BIVA|nr:hypothetical protein CHS0354_000831 [Potamilus streckersoni]
MAKEILPKTYVTKNETIGAVVNFEKTSVGIQGKTVNGSFAVEVWDEKIIRTRVTKREQFETQPYAVHVKPDPSVKWNFFESNTSITITTKKITAVIHKHLFRVSFRDASGKIINEDDTSFGVSWIGDEMTVYKSLQEGERFIGLGEKTGPLNRRGQGYTNWNTDYCGYPEITDPIYATIPFYVGITKSSLYGLFLNNSYKSHFNFGAANTRFSSITVEHGDIDYFFIHDASIPGIIERYTYLTGRMPLPPMWSLGYHQSRYSYFPDNNAIIVATSFRARGIPCDAITLDIHYMDAYKVFTWHPTRYANPQEFTSLLRQLGFHTTVIIDPGIKIEDGYSVYEDGKKSNAFVTYPDGTNYVGELMPERGGNNN